MTWRCLGLRPFFSVFHRFPSDNSGKFYTVIVSFFTICYAKRASFVGYESASSCFPLFQLLSPWEYFFQLLSKCCFQFVVFSWYSCIGHWVVRTLKLVWNCQKNVKFSQNCWGWSGLHLHHFAPLNVKTGSHLKKTLKKWPLSFLASLRLYTFLNICYFCKGCVLP